MTETQKRIKAYKEALPGLRERVIAVALLLAMSASMLTSATFAWLTLSQAPEVSGASTTVAANGNLEIALAGVYDETGKLIEPAESAVGDSSATAGQSIVAANLTWGNLVNLSDPSYGLDQVILRPASLNAGALNTSPFRSAVYGEDGRVENSNFNEFSYCTWQVADESSPAHFVVSDLYGVRAISTVTTRFEADLGASQEDLENVVLYNDMLNGDGGPIKLNYDVDTIYQNDLIGNTQYMNDLCAVIGLFMTAKMNSGDAEYQNPNMVDYMDTLVNMFTLFYSAMNKELEAMAALANVQQFVNYKNLSYESYSANTLRTATVAELEAKGVHLDEFEQFVKDLALVEKDLQILIEAKAYGDEYGVVNFTDIDDVVTDLVNVNECLVHSGSTTVRVGDIHGATDALNLLGSDMQVEIMEGILPRFEKRTGTYAYLDNYSVRVTIKIDSLGGYVHTQNVQADVYTQYRNKVCLFNDDVKWTEDAFDASGMANGKAIETAGDTYGLAIDLWVRTNASTSEEDDTSYLVLEGKLIQEAAPGVDGSGNEVGELFYYETTNESTLEVTRTYVYRDANGQYFVNESNESAGDLSGKTLTAVYKDAPIGYEGENRLWEEWQQAQLTPSLSENNTTQGDGSCFTFYASPTEQQAVLNLLSHMYVVFTDDVGTYLATASFDTAENHYYSVGGKATVPLTVSQTDYYFADENGNTVSAIMPLQRNKATRVTALVYLDGTNLTNKEALSASDMQGTLNIQFGSSSQLQTLGDKELQRAERIVTAQIKTAKADNVLDYFEDNLTAEVSVSVTGDQPSTIKAFFQREINSFQGSREEVMVFENGKATHTFNAPGTYVLRSVQLDGEDYELSEPQKVVVEGFEVKDVAVFYNDTLISNASDTIVTADSYVKLGLSMEMNAKSADEIPTSTQLVFMRSDASTITVDMARSGSVWTGETTLNSSGVYELSYAILNGEIYDIGNDAKTLTLYMGMRAEVSAQPGTPLSVPLEMDETTGKYTPKTLYIRTRLRDNAGNYLGAQEAVWLRYRAASGEYMEAELTWNDSTEYYEGQFLAENPAIYTFQYLKVGSSTVSNSSNSVIFNVFSNSPVSYLGCENDGITTFAMPDVYPANMILRFMNAKGSTMQATFENEKGNRYTVEADDSGNIKLPELNEKGEQVSGGSQGGTWKLVELKLANVSDEKGEKYGPQYNDDGTPKLDESGNQIVTWLTIDPVKEDGTYPTITVVADYQISLEDDQGTMDFSGLFMDTHTKPAGDLTLKVYYGDNVALPVTVSEVKLTYQHQRGTSSAYGSYSMPSGVSEPEKVVTMVNTSGDNITFVQESAISLRHAGEYKLTSISLKIGAKEIAAVPSDKMPVNAQLMKVSSARPVVKFTSTNPAAGTNFTGANADGNGTTTRQNTLEAYSITCWYGASTSSWSCNGYTATKATATLSSAGENYSTGTVAFEQGTGGTVGVTFTFTQDAAADTESDTKSVGADGNDRSYVGTDAKATTLVLVYNSVEYNFTLQNVMTITCTG